MKFLILVFLVSCATQTIFVDQKNLLPYKEANQLTKLSSVSKPVHLKLVEVTNLSQTLGTGYTGVQYNKTPILFKQSPKVVLTSFFVNALEMRNILLDESSKRKLEIHINELSVNEIIKKFQGEKASCRANVTFYVEDVANKWSGNYWTEFLSASDLREGTERIAPTLASCLNEVVEKLIKDEKFLTLIR